MTASVDEGVPVLLAEPVDVFVSVGVGDVDVDSIGDRVTERRGVGISCKMGNSFSTACHTVSVSQHWPASS